MAQTYIHWECIVIDDHSTDKSVSIVQEYIANHPGKFKLIYNARKGACAARNIGFENSKGDYIQYLDADDILGENKIENQIMLLQDKKDCISTCNWVRFFDHINEKELKQGMSHEIMMDQDALPWLTKNKMVTLHAWLTPKSIIDKTGGWNESLVLSQDGEFFARVVVNAKKVLFCSDVEVYYRSNLFGSISSKYETTEGRKSNFKAIASIEHVVLEQFGKMDMTAQLLADKYQNFVYRTFPFETKLINKAQEKILYYGGSALKPPFRGKTKILSNIFGWKLAKRIKYLIKL